MYTKPIHLLVVGYVYITLDSMDDFTIMYVSLRGMYVLWFAL